MCTDNFGDRLSHTLENKSLVDKIEKLEAEKKSLIIKEDKYSHYVQMLILDYLGIAKGKKNTEKAKIYAPLIRRDIKTTTQYFSDLYANKNEKNLEIIIDFFEKAGFPDLVQVVKDDLNRLKKRKH